MVFVLPQVETFGQAFGKNFGAGLGQGIEKGLENRQRLARIAQIKAKGGAGLADNVPGSQADATAQGLIRPQSKSQQSLLSAEAAFDAGEHDLGNYYLQEAKLSQKEEQEERKNTKERVEPVLEEARKARTSLPGKKTALNLFKEAIDEGIGPLSFANVADKINHLAGTNLFPENASAKEAAYASKTYLVENLSKVGAKGLNQFLEKQIIQAQPSIGSSEKGNRAVLHAMESAYDIEKNYVDTVGKLQDMYEDVGLSVPKKAVRDAEKLSQKYADERIKQLAVDLKENDEKGQSDEEVMGVNKQGIMKKVAPGTPLTQRNARLFKIRFGKKAEEKAKALGYETEYPVLPTLEE